MDTACGALSVTGTTLLTVTIHCWTSTSKPRFSRLSAALPFYVHYILIILTNYTTSKQARDNADFTERVKGGLLAAAGLLIFNPKLIATGLESVTKPETNNFGSHS